MKEWFKARNAWGAGFAALPDAEAGRLAKALWQYTMTGIAPEVSGGIAGIFAMLRFQLDQDEEAAQEISDARAAAGRKSASLRKQTEANSANADFVEQNPTNPTNADFVEQNEANEANAHNKNKNKNKSKNNNIEEDDEEEEDITRARADAVEAIHRGFRNHFGRYPTPAETEQLTNQALLNGTPPSLIPEAIRITAARGAKSPAPYIGKIFREWASEYIETVEDLESYTFLKDAAAGRNEYGSTDIDARMEAARHERMEKHTREAGS